MVVSAVSAFSEVQHRMQMGRVQGECTGSSQCFSITVILARNCSLDNGEMTA